MTIDQPDKIDKYDIQATVGRGSMGVVYLGHDPFTDESVALKLCPAGDDETREGRLARKLFLNEAHTAGSLDHPNILGVRDAGEHDGQPYIVMEYVPGARTLQEFVDPGNLLPVLRTVEILYDVAKALDYAHHRGVVHRDIKPSNLMLTESDRVMIGDFGIAQYAASDFTQVMGTFSSPRYMSPEQAMDEELTHQTDIYSLGVIAYELLCGRPPFAARSISELVRKILEAQPESLHARRPEVSSALERIVGRAMHKNLLSRYQSGQEFASDLAGMFKGLSTREEELGPEEKHEVLRNLDFFNEFSDDEVDEVARSSEWHHQHVGDELITEGSLEHSFFILVSGRVNVLKNGKQISSLEAGDCFGEMGYLTKAERTASIHAVDDVVLLQINSTLMDQASMSCQLRFTQVFLRTLIERLARTSVALSQYVE